MQDEKLEDERSKLNEQFRDPHLLIDTIQALKTKQDEDIAELRTKLVEFDEIKKVLARSYKILHL